MTIADTSTTTGLSPRRASSIVTGSFDAKKGFVTALEHDKEEAKMKPMMKRLEGSMDTSATAAASSLPSSSSRSSSWFGVSSWAGFSKSCSNHNSSRREEEEEEDEDAATQPETLPVITSMEQGENEAYSVEVPFLEAQDEEEDDGNDGETRHEGGGGEEEEEEEEEEEAKNEGDEETNKEELVEVQDGGKEPLASDAKVMFEESRLEKDVQQKEDVQEEEEEEDVQQKEEEEDWIGREREYSVLSEPTPYRSASNRHLFDASISSSLSALSLPQRRAKDLESSKERHLVRESLRSGLLFQSFPSARTIDTSTRAFVDSSTRSDPSPQPPTLEAPKDSRQQQGLNHHKARNKMHQRVHEILYQAHETPEDVTLLEMCYLSEIIYKCHDLAGEWDALTYDLQDMSHVLLGKGIRQNITWMVTTCGNTTHVILKGFDASDPRIDRAAFLKDGGHSTATFLHLSTLSSAEVAKEEEEEHEVQLAIHGRLWEIAQALYEYDIRPFLLSTLEQQGGEKKLNLLGHSFGGSLSIMLLLLVYRDYGVDVVRSKINCVYTFGSPPVLCLVPPKDTTSYDMPRMEHAGGERQGSDDDTSDDDNVDHSCAVLNALGLPTDTVMGYNQPWDPFVRMFTPYDVLYPLTAMVQSTRRFGPRFLRPVTGRLMKNWSESAHLLENFLQHGRPFAHAPHCNLVGFSTVGTQFLLVASWRKYMRDRFGRRGRLFRSPAVPTPHAIVQVSCRELLPLLHTIYPIAPDYHLNGRVDTLIRSLWHHIPDSYTLAVVKYIQRQRKTKGAARKGTNQMTRGMETLNRDSRREGSRTSSN